MQLPWNMCKGQSWGHTRAPSWYVTDRILHRNKTVICNLWLIHVHCDWYIVHTIVHVHWYIHRTVYVRNVIKYLLLYTVCTWYIDWHMIHWLIISANSPNYVIIYVSTILIFPTDMKIVQNYKTRILVLIWNRCNMGLLKMWDFSINQ